ncbi:AraC family transcriptional regulator [Pseudonocardia asaccharolytica]|uniref:Transcriptional regulator n=1 Tax=Pseudonocardia asaccharolytica DSM 44247 = NBRC 16224 TaxID=1123024 RepID=A0A511DBR2_9PSEU|nr:AraC family transcriptional regulator [Pseudonocardia asaccharolytica]GEL20378.1 transcriptional regulator [Pseudonocardia asaccharolytica DSM 44247 = NBRC 16224]
MLRDRCGVHLSPSAVPDTPGPTRAVFQTSDPDRARAELRRTYYPLRLRQLETAAPFQFAMSTRSAGPLTLGRVQFGSAVELDAGELEIAYHVNIPLTGEVLSRCGDQQVLANPSTAAVFTPTGHATLDRWAPGSVQLCLKIDRRAVENELAERLGRPLSTPVRFALALDLTTPAAQGWLDAVRMLSRELRQPGGLADSPLLAAEIHRLIITGLLLTQPHNYSDELHSGASPHRPKTISNALDLIEADAERAWTVIELAKACGVSVRGLEEGFRRYVGVSPHAYQRDRRLDRAHADLLAAHPGQTSVAVIARRWGFPHAGRFAHIYRRRFGVAPSATLRGLRP